MFRSDYVFDLIGESWRVVALAAVGAAAATLGSVTDVGVFQDLEWWNGAVLAVGLAAWHAFQGYLPERASGE